MSGLSEQNLALLERDGGWCANNPSGGDLGVVTMSDLDRILDAARAEGAANLSEVMEENADLKSSVISFCAPWAVTYARDFGFPPGHLHPTHYDILAKCGARMDDFTRGDPSLLSREG